MSQNSILYNDYYNSGLELLDMVAEEGIDNELFSRTDLSSDENCMNLFLEKSYDYRPELVAKKLYGDEKYYPIVLVCNKIGTLLHFKIENFDNVIKVLKPEIFQRIFQSTKK